MYNPLNDLIAQQGKKAAKAKVKPKSSYSLRKAILEFVASENAKVPVERRVSNKSAITVAERSLNRTTGLEKQARLFIAFRDVASFVAFATTGLNQNTVASNTDLLPIGHPQARRRHNMSEFALRDAYSRWVAADPRIDDSVRDIVAAAYLYPSNTVEHMHAVSRLSALTAGLVPREIAIIAVGGLGLGGNSSAAKSLRARLQRRDRNGQFAEQGGGLRFYGIKDGKVYSVLGKFVGNSEKTDGFLVEVKNDPAAPDGIYDVPALKAEAVEAFIRSKKGDVAQPVQLPSGVDAVDLNTPDMVDYPGGWELVSEKKAGEKGPDKVFKSFDGYRVDYYEPGNEDVKGAIQKAWKFNTPIGSGLSQPPNVKNADGMTGPQAKLDKDEPVFVMYRDKTDVTPEKSVSISQSWSDTQDFAAADEKDFANEYEKGLDSKAKQDKALEKSKISQEESIKKSEEIMKANDALRAEIEDNLSKGLDPFGNEIPDGWTVEKNDDALNPPATSKIDGKEYVSTPIKKEDTVSYTRTEQGYTASLSHNEDGSLRGLYQDQDFETWEDANEGFFEEVEQDVNARREAAIDAAESYDDSGEIRDMVENGASPDEILEKLSENGKWNQDKEDFDTSWAVDLPSKSQKDSWKEFEKKLNAIKNMPKEFTPPEKKEEEKPKAVIKETSEPVKAPAKTDVDVSDFIVPENSYKLQLATFEPEGRTDQDSSDYTDDPKVIANKFATPELTDALAEALTGKKDFATLFLEKLAEEEDEDEEDTGKKKKTGPKPKKPEKPEIASGYGALGFSEGDEFVPAEAIYQALEEQGVDARQLVAEIYDSKSGESKNVDMLTKGKTEDVKAIEPSVLLDSEEVDDIESIIKLNETLAQPDSSAVATSMINEFSKSKDPNERINEMADALAKVQGPDGYKQALDQFIEWGLEGDEDQKQAFRGLFAIMLSGDGGYAAVGEDSEFKTAVGKSIEKYKGTVTPEEIDALFEEFGYWTDLLESKKKLVTDEESINDKDSLAGSFYRLIAQLKTPTNVELYRGMQLEEDSDALKRLTDQGSIISLDPRSFSLDKGIAGKFAGALTAKPAKGMNSVILTVKKGEGDSVNITNLSPFQDEQEHIVAGDFRIAEVRKKTLPTGHTLYNVRLEKISEREAVLEGYSDNFEQFLLENKSVDLPDDYYGLDPDAYTPMEITDASIPEEFDDSPLTIARLWETDDLIEIFRDSVEDGSGKVNLIYPGGYEAVVAAEAARDALQIQGIDTNAILDDIANASPDANATDVDEAEAAESNADDVIEELATDISTEYDMQGWKKVGPQLGSNEGGFYEDAEGNRFYVKTPKSDLHAQNEALASALYRALGVDAAEIYIGSADDGKKKTYSPDIIGSKQDLQEKLNDPEYLAKLQEGFAVDAWLANWDVAGLVFDNVMSDGDGNPVRVDPGGALLFRAQGAPKGKLFGNEVNELDTLRDKNMNPQSASVFGSMTDEQQKESARKLLDISHDDIDTLVDSVIEDENVAEKLKDTLKARRQFILERYDLLGDDTSLIAETTDISDEDSDVQEKKAADSVESRMETLYDWADSYSGADDNYTENKQDQEYFKEVANQIDAALVDYRNGDITDDGMPQVIDELKNFIQTYNWSDDEKTQSNVDDLVDQLDMIKSNFYTPKPEEPTPAVVEPATDAVNNPYITSDGMPIDPGMKVVYIKTGETGTVIKYDKGNTNYVYVQMDGETKPKVKSTKQLSSMSEKETQKPSTPEVHPQIKQAQEDSELSPLELPNGVVDNAFIYKQGRMVWNDLQNNWVVRDDAEGKNLGTADTVEDAKSLIDANGSGGKGAGPKAPEPSPAPATEEPTAKPDVEPQDLEEDTTPEDSDVKEQDVGQFEPTAQLTEDGTKVRVSFIVDGRPFNPNSDTGPNSYEDIMPYVKDEKLDVDGVDEVTVEVPLDKMDEFGKAYKQILQEPFAPGEFYGDIYNDYKENQESKKSENLQLWSKTIKDILKKQGINISDEKANEIRDAIEENDLIEKWGSATDKDIESAILDVVGPGIVDISGEPAVEEKTTPSTSGPIPVDTSGTVDDLAKQINSAIKSKKDITFNYNGKTRTVTPMSIWTNPKNGNINMYAIDLGDEGKKKNFTLTNIESIPGGAPAPEITKTEEVSAEEAPKNIPDSEKLPEPEKEEVSGPPVAPEGEMKISDVNGNDVFKGVEITDKKGNKGTVLKVNKDNYALVEFEDGTKGWRSANTISTTGNVNSAALSKAYTPKKGKVTPAGTQAIVVENPLEWNSSDFEGTPSLLDAIELVQTPDSKTAPMRGASAAVDSDSIEDLDVRVMRVRNAEGEDSLQFKFKLTAWAGNAKAKELIPLTKDEAAAKGITRTSLTVDRLDIGEDGVGQISKVKNAYTANGGYTWTITTDDGIVIKFTRANTDATNKTPSGKYGNSGRAFHNLVTITAPAGVKPEQIAKALSIAGVQDVRPAMQGDARILVENRLMSVLDAKTDATKNLSGKEREESLARIEKKYGITPDDVVITTGASGRLETRLKPEAAQKIVEATGSPAAIKHNLSIGVPSYGKSDEQFADEFSDILLNLFATPQGGLLSTTTRWTEGIGTNGMSSYADVGTGGADYVFTRPVKDAEAKKFGTSGVVMYFDPNKVYQRLDFYANYTDAFGKRQSSQDVISAAKVGAYEVMFKHRLGWDDLDVTVVPNQAVRTRLIQKLRQRGIDQLGGKPLEEAIIIGSEKEKK